MATVAMKAGTRKVPIFNAGYSLAPLSGFHDFGSSLTFAANSTDCLIPISANVSYPATLNRFAAPLVSVNGLSLSSVNPTSPVADGPTLEYIDGAVVFNSTGNPSSYWHKAQSPAPGTYNISPLKSYSYGFTYLSVLGTPYPLSYKTQNLVGFTWTDLSFNYHVGIFGDTTTTYLADMGGNTQTFGAQGGVNVRCPQLIYADNALIFAPYLGSGGWGLMLYDSNDPAVSVLWKTGLQFDDATLNAVFAGAQLVSTAEGFLFTLATNGTGPTGAWSEVVLVSPDWLSYEVIQLVGGDASSQAALALQGGYPAAAMIDSLGILWWNPGGTGAINLEIFTSYSPFPPIPTPQFAPIPPLVLPCSNWCSPLTF